MNDQIICPNCKKTIPLTEALSQQIQEKYQKFYKIRLEEEKNKLSQSLRIELEKKIKDQWDLQIKDKTNEAEELKKQNKSLQDQFLDLNKLIRQLKTENEQKGLEMEKKLAVEQEKIRQEERKHQDEENRMKFLEYEKKLADVSKVNEDLKRKLEQGSQQTQGEVVELELENKLKAEFPWDEIKPVAKGVRGADIVQIVKNKSGQICGTIVWESKRTKAWSEPWLNKLKEDQRQIKAELAVIITNILPEEIKNIGFKDGIWITNYQSVIGLAIALRTNLLGLASMKLANVGKKEKMEILYNYLLGIEFRQRIEAISEAFSSMQVDIEKEKRWFTAKWAKEEKNLRQVFDNMAGMRGDLESITGKALEIKNMELLPEEVA